MYAHLRLALHSLYVFIYKPNIIVFYYIFAILFIRRKNFAHCKAKIDVKTLREMKGVVRFQYISLLQEHAHTYITVIRRYTYSFHRYGELFYDMSSVCVLIYASNCVPNEFDTGDHKPKAVFGNNSIIHYSAQAKSFVEQTILDDIVSKWSYLHIRRTLIWLLILELSKAHCLLMLGGCCFLCCITKLISRDILLYAFSWSVDAIWKWAKNLEC